MTYNNFSDKCWVTAVSNIDEDMRDEGDCVSSKSLKMESFHWIPFGIIFNCIIAFVPHIWEKFMETLFITYDDKLIVLKCVSRYMVNNTLAHCLKIVQNVAFEIFVLLSFSNFCPFKVNLFSNTVWLQASIYQKLAKIDQFWHFYELSLTQKICKARFARNVEWDFFCDFQTLCCIL